jgi:hypothetical protein
MAALGAGHGPPRGPGAVGAPPRAIRHLQRAQADLAVALATGDQVGIARAREELAQARHELGQLPQHPPVVGRTVGTWSIVLGLAGLFVPVVGVAAVVVALVGLAYGRAEVARQRGARITPRLWVGLALGVLAVALFVVATSR